MNHKTTFLLLAVLWGAAFSGTWAQGQAGTDKPGFPKGLSAAATEKGVQLTWDPAKGMAFNLYRTDPKGKVEKKLNAQPITDGYALLDRLDPAKTYYFILTAVNPAGAESAPTEPLKVQVAELEKQTSDQDSGDQKDVEEALFTPHWTGQVGYVFSSQNSGPGPGEVTQEISLTGNYYFSESGHYFSMVAGGGQETLEGANTSYGTFSAGGGLVFGVFQPTLTVAFQQGAEALNSLDGTLTLNFQFFKPFALGLILEGNPQSHQGALSTVLGGNSDQIDEIDSVDLTGGLVATFTPWDFLDLTLTGEQDDSTTYQWQNILHTAVHPLNQTEQIPSVTLAADITFLEVFTLDLSLQEGEEYIPAGVSYNPILKKTQDFSSATTQSFSGYMAGLIYNL